MHQGEHQISLRKKNDLKKFTCKRVNNDSLWCNITKWFIKPWKNQVQINKLNTKNIQERVIRAHSKRVIYGCAQKQHKIEVSVRIRPRAEKIDSVTLWIQVNKSSGELVVNNNFHVFTNNLIIGSDQKICFEDTAARLV